MGRFELRFPCGTIIRGRSIWMYFGDRDFDEFIERGCPLHGKTCRAIR